MGIKKLVVAAMSAGFIISVASVASLADSNTGWRDNGLGDWRYYTSDDEYLTDCWKKDNGRWYYLYSDGVALTNQWAYIEGKLYYFNSSGAMETSKWIECGDIELPVNAIEKVYQALSKLFTISATEKVYHLET